MRSVVFKLNQREHFLASLKKLLKIILVSTFNKEMDRRFFMYLLSLSFFILI